MADAAFLQHSFTGGEWSKAMQGRSDRPDYRTALNVCLNAMPLEQGAWQRRAGFAHCGPTRGGAAGRVIAFDFDQAAPYSIEFTDGHLRFWAGTQIATTNDDAAVIAISTATPAVAQLAAAVTWSTGNQAVLKLLGTACPPLQNRVLTLTKINTTHFSMADAITGAAIDGSAIGSLAVSVKIGRVLDIAAPYTAGAWADVRGISADIPTTQGTTPGVVLLNHAIAPYVLQVGAEPTATTFATFSLAAPLILDGPYFDAVTTGETLTISAASGSVTIIASGTAFGGFKSTDVGRLMRFLIEPPAFNSGSSYTGGDVVASPPTTLTTAPQYWRCIAAGSTSVSPGTDVTAWVPWVETKDVAIWSWAIITGFTSATQVTATLSVGIPVYSAVGGPGSPPTLPITLWRMGLYSDTTGWPTCGTYHEGRLWLSGVVPNRIDASSSNNAFDFAPTTIIGQVLDSSAIAYRFNAPDVNPIFWMSPEGQGIVCGTQAGEWLVQASTLNERLTPTNIQAHRHTKNGCANIEPRRTDHTLVVVQRFRRKLLEYFADVFSGKYSAQNILAKNEPLSKPYIAEIAYQQELIPTIWARTDAGTLIGVTYVRNSLVSSQEATAGSHRHTLGSGRRVESITAGPSSDGNLDALTIVTNDPVTGIRHVELMATAWEEGDDVTSAAFLDDAIRPSSTVITASPSAGAPYGGITLNGLSAHNGKVLQVFAGGLDCGDPGEGKPFADFTVSNGAVFVPFGDGISAGSGAGQFTAAVATAAAAAGTIVVGFTYTSDGQIVPPIAPAESGARNGPAFGKTSRIHRYAIQVYDTAGLSIGTDFARLLTAPFRSLAGAGPALAAGALAQGTYRDDIQGDNEIGPKICWRITRPWPANIAALGGMIHTQDL